MHISLYERTIRIIEKHRCNICPVRTPGMQRIYLSRVYTSGTCPLLQQKIPLRGTNKKRMSTSDIDVHRDLLSPF